MFFKINSQNNNLSHNYIIQRNYKPNKIKKDFKRMESPLQSSTPVSFLKNDKDLGKISSYYNIKQSNSQLKLNPQKLISNHSNCTKPILFTEKASACPNCLNYSQLNHKVHNEHPDPHFNYTNENSQYFNLFPYHRPSHYENKYRRKYYTSRRNDDSAFFYKNPNQSKIMLNHNNFKNSYMNAPQPAYVPTHLALPTSYIPVTFQQQPNTFALPIKSLPHSSSSLNLNNQLSTQFDADKLAILLNLMEEYIKELKKTKYENTIKQNSLYHRHVNKDLSLCKNRVINPFSNPKTPNLYDNYKKMSVHSNLIYNNPNFFNGQFPFVSPSNDFNSPNDFGCYQQISNVF